MSYLEISPLNFTQDLTIKSVKLFCSCCLLDNVNLIATSNCHHYLSYKMFFHSAPARTPNDLYVCMLCHAMLKKIYKFNLMVKQSEFVLRNQVKVLDRLQFIKLETTNQNEEITLNHETDSEYIKTELTEEFEVKTEPGDTNTDQDFRFSPDIEDNDLTPCTFEPTPADDVKVCAVPEEWAGKIEYLNLASDQLERERREVASQESFMAFEYKCHDCILGFNFEYKYKSHMESKHVQKEINSVLCEICKCYVASRNVRNHLAAHYGRWKCLQCEIMVKSKYAVIAHYNKAHEKLEGYEFKCNECNHVSRSYKALRYHEKKHKRNGLNYNCEECRKLFATKESYTSHMESLHASKQTFECKKCNKSFKSKNYLRFHTKQVHEENISIYFCELCNVTFKNILTYKNHEARHSTLFECDYCGLKYNSKQSIKDHILTKHLKNCTAACPICSKAFSTKKSLNAHIKGKHRTTECPRNKICHYCGKGFAKSVILMTHLNTHTGARPYDCKFCSANFGHKAALYNHTRLVHYGGKRKREMISVAE